MSTPEVRSAIAVTPPQNGESGLMAVQKSPNEVNELFQKVLSLPSRQLLRTFLKEVKEAQLDLKEYEKYLGLFVTASIFTIKEKAKQLFLHACSLLFSDEALKFLEAGQFDRQQLLTELLSVETTPSMAFQLVCQPHCSLDGDLATIPYLMRLIHEEVDVNAIVIEGLHPIEWIIKHNESLLANVLSYSARLALSLLKSEIVKQYLAKKLQCPIGTISCTQIIKSLKEFGVTIIDGNNALFSHACTTDDYALAQSLLDEESFDPSGQYDGTPHLLAACQKPNAQKIPGLLLQRGTNSNVAHSATKETPLHAALRNDNPELCMALLLQSADLLAEDRNKETPLQLMMQSDKKEIRHLCQYPDIYIQSWDLKQLVQVLKKLHLKTRASQELFDLLSALIQSKYDQAKLNTPEGVEFFYELVRLNAYKAIQKAIQTGFSLYRSKEQLISHFSKDVILAHQEVFIYLLSSDFLHQDAKSIDETPLIFIVLSNPHCGRLLAQLHEKRVSLTSRTKDGDTLLHFYCKNGGNDRGIESIRKVLSLGMDVNALDIHRRPALYYALQPLKPEIVEMLLFNGAHPFHLSDRIINYISFVQQDRLHLLFSKFKVCEGYTQTYGSFFHAVQHRGSAFPEELLEISFLLPASEFSPARYFRTKEEYLVALGNLRKKYPDAPKEYFFPFLLQLNHEHFKRRTLDFQIPPITKQVNIQKLLNDFDGLNWQIPQAPNYCDPTKVRISKFTHKREDLRGAFQKLLGEYVPFKTAFTGTPLAGTNELRVFYDNLELLLKHIVLLLDEEQDATIRTKYLLKLAWSAIYCGTRWEETALRIYQKLKYKKTRETLLEDKFDELLSLLREQIVSDLNKGNIHGYRYYLKSIGEKYNIPLSQGVSKVSETHQPQNLTPDLCESYFCAAYNASLIVPTTITFFETSFLKPDGVLKRWFNNHTPADYSFKGFKELCWSAKALELFYKTPEQYRAAVQHLFKEKEYIVPANFASISEVLTGIHQGEYFDKMVYDIDTAKVHSEGFIHFLQTRGVLKEPFKGIFKDFFESWQKT